MHLPAARYTQTAIVLHWLLVVAFFAQIAFGWFLEEVPRGTPERTLYVNFHKSSGMIALVALLIDLLSRLIGAELAMKLVEQAWAGSARPAASTVTGEVHDG